MDPPPVHRQQRKVQIGVRMPEVLMEKLAIWQGMAALCESHLETSHARWIRYFSAIWRALSLAALTPTSKTVSNIAPPSRSSPLEPKYYFELHWPSHRPQASPMPIEICLHPGDRSPYHGLFRTRTSNGHPNIPGRCRRFELSCAEHQLILRNILKIKLHY